MLHELSVRVLEEEVVVDQSLPRDDAEEMDQGLGGLPDVSADDFAAGGRVEDG